MQISKIGQQNKQSFKGILNNKALLRGLEKVSEHGATIGAATCLAGSLVLRPLAISLTPKTKEENKKYSMANSICSGLTKFAIAEAIILPIENAVKKIDKNPKAYLKKQTIENLQVGANELVESKNYKFATQVVKMGAGFIAAIPKSALTVALIPFVANVFLKNIDKKEQKQKEEINFTGGITNKVAQGVGKILDSKTFQKAANKGLKHEENIAKISTIATDVFLTALFVKNTKKSKKIEPERKKPLIYNSIISTAATALGANAIDNAIKKSSANLVEKFKKANANDPKLYKYIEGINILRPTIIFALLYYGILPVISTFASEKIDNFTNKKEAK